MLTVVIFPMNNSYIGLNGDYGECHKLSYSRKKGFKDVKNFAAEELKILFLRADTPFPLIFLLYKTKSVITIMLI